MRGTPKTKDGSGIVGSGGGTGLISTWKRLKGKKKKQRNLTAPEISTQDVKTAMTDEADSTSTSMLTPLKEGVAEKREGGKGKGIFGRKQSKTSADSKESLKPPVAEIVFRNERAESPIVSDDNVLSQKSEPTLSQPDEAADGEMIGTDLATNSKSSVSDYVVLEPLDLSQTSGKHSGASLSQSETFAGIEDHCSTHSSTEAVVSNVESQHNIDNDSALWDNSEVIKEEGRVDYGDGGFYWQVSTKLYKDYGNKQHKLNLESVHEFLESSGEIEPADLSVLQEWDGWMVASREIM